MGYEYLEDIAVADVAFRAWSDTVEGLFVAACDACMNVMVADLDTIGAGEGRTLRVEADETDMLLFDLLQELIFYKDAEQLLLRVKRVSIERRADGVLALTAQANGEALDPEKHDLVVDVKAVTLHRFSVEQTESGWEATVILDI